VPGDEDDDDSSGLVGFSEAAVMPDFTSHMERVRSMSDEELLNAHRVLSNARVVVDGLWLPMLEAEMQQRGLITRN
jgi:hypothetical protein